MDIFTKKLQKLIKKQKHNKITKTKIQMKI